MARQDTSRGALGHPLSLKRLIWGYPIGARLDESIYEARIEPLIFLTPYGQEGI